MAGSGIGDTLFGRFQITDLLGEGGQGTVWKGVDIKGNHPVAIKELTAEAEELRIRFRNEAELSLEPIPGCEVPPYRHIVRPVHFGEEGGTYYFVMEYVQGENLKEILSRERKVPEAEAVRVVEQVAWALRVAHANNIIHRDVKPENIIVTKKGLVKVTDFGIACFLTKDRRTQLGATMGTVHYMSPEQVEDATKVDCASDMFSLGVVFYEMVTGVRPFDSELMGELFLKIINEDPLPPRKVVATLSPKVEAVILRMLKKNAAERFPSMEALLGSLPREPGAPGDEARTGVHCPECKRVNRFDSNFCQGCGTDLRPTCAGCGKVASAQDRFCRRCGSPLARKVKKAILVGLKGAFLDQRLVVDKDFMTIGRHISNDLSFAQTRDVYVSRFQARLYRERGQYWIEGWDWVKNAASTNGTFVNGNNVDGKGRVLLQPGDKLRVGDSFFRYEVLHDDHS